MKIFLLLCLVTYTKALDNGLALTPPMGWMSWERFRCITNCEKYPKECISENLIMEMADVMVEEGYLEAGYEYVNIDDCWSELERDENGKIVANKERFPRGKKFLSDYVHSKGLKIGTYLDYGTKTCAGYPGSLDFVEKDVESLAEWEVDFLKLDGCNVETSQMIEGYENFSRLMNKTGRPIMYSCSWPAYFEYYRKPAMDPNFEVLKRTCNLWRNWKDIEDSWESVLFISDFYAENQDRVANHSGPGHWNDPDTLLLGNYGLSYDQSKAQLAVWAILAAPFLISTDLRAVKPEIKELLLNRHIISVDQDIFGIQGRFLQNFNGIDIWTRKISPKIGDEYSYAVAFVSRRADGHPYEVSISLKHLNLGNKFGYLVKDLFYHEKKAHQYMQTDSFDVRVNPTGANFYKFIPIE